MWWVSYGLASGYAEQASLTCQPPCRMDQEKKGWSGKICESQNFTKNLFYFVNVFQIKRDNLLPDYMFD